MIGKLTSRYKEWKSYKERLKKTSKIKFHLLDTVETLLVALCLALLIRHYIIQTSLVPTSSMVPTLKVGDRLFVNKFIYRFKKPERGDIIVFKSPNDDGKDYVKRCIGLPGERIEIKKGIVYINNKKLILSGVDVQYDKDTHPALIVPQNAYFALGDNRAHSSDSRVWGFVPEENLLGEALYTFWPFPNARVLR